jgi:predicted MPP superfamily phosphohydrolase
LSPKNTNHLKLKTTLILFLLALVGFFILKFWLPGFVIPYINFTFLLLLSYYLWTAILPRIRQKKAFVKYGIGIVYWFPMFLTSIASIGFVLIPIEKWPHFLRVYFVGGLFSYVVGLLLPVIFLFFADIVRFFEALLRKNSQNRAHKVSGESIGRRKFIVNTGLALGGLALGTMGFGMLHGNYDFKIWRYKIRLSNIPDGLRGLRIVQISDFHLGTWVSKKPLIEAIEVINDLNPDLVFFTGDLVNSMTSEAFPFADELSQIRAKHGVFASIGNHDYGHYYKWKNEQDEQKNWDDLISLYDGIGWKLLRNEHQLITINDAKLAVVGVENWSSNPRFPRLGDLEKATNSLNNSQINLLLSHDPTHWDEIVKDFHVPMHITFSGHTHGFQFGIESSLFRWSPAQYIYKHWAGLYRNESHERWLNVNRGIGAIGFPGRVGIKPEITLVELA